MNISISKPKRTKEDLLETLYNLKEDFVDEIDDDDVKIKKIKDGLSFNVKKSFIFYVEGKIKVMDGLYEITYETNVPDFKVKPMINKLNSMLMNC
ncbi:MAG TPA: hypothetical protein PKA90_07810 [Ignavibacteria bacterium]|nr:hypothetical protein [Ignavibacteria bacterium]HMR40323.1 hypothetical protein [Ignavibacteria bacterium]